MHAIYYTCICLAGRELIDLLGYATLTNFLTLLVGNLLDPALPGLCTWVEKRTRRVHHAHDQRSFALLTLLLIPGDRVGEEFPSLTVVLPSLTLSGLRGCGGAAE